MPREAQRQPREPLGLALVAPRQGEASGVDAALRAPPQAQDDVPDLPRHAKGASVRGQAAVEKDPVLPHGPRLPARPGDPLLQRAAVGGRVAAAEDRGGVAATDVDAARQPALDAARQPGQRLSPPPRQQVPQRCTHTRAASSRQTASLATPSAVPVAAPTGGQFATFHGGASWLEHRGPCRDSSVCASERLRWRKPLADFVVARRATGDVRAGFSKRAGVGRAHRFETALGDALRRSRWARPTLRESGTAL